VNVTDNFHNAVIKKGMFLTSPFLWCPKGVHAMPQT